MVLIKSVPVTSSRRFLVSNKAEVSKKPSGHSLISGRHFPKGRNCYGRITLRHRGGGHKRLWRAVDFKRSKLAVPAVVEAIEYDPNRSALLALLKYADGEKSYILAPEGAFFLPPIAREPYWQNASENAKNTIIKLIII